MQLNNEIIDYIKRVTNAALAIGMDTVILSEEVVRAKDDTMSKFLIHTEDLPKLDFDYIVLTRLANLNQRLALAGDNITVEAETKTDDTELEACIRLNIKSDKTSIEYRTSTASHLRVPRRVRDEFSTSFSLTPDDINLIQLAVRAMPQNKEKMTIAFMSQGGEVTLEIIDVNKDKYTQVVGRTNCPAFAHRYETKSVLSLLRQADKEHGIEFFIGEERGYLKTTINGFDCYMVPNQE